jgi:hypothetical protein
MSRHSAWPEVFQPLAELLRCVADPPGLRQQPRAGDLEGPWEFWFDGGAGVAITGGGWRYAFADGRQAWVSGGLPVAGAAGRLKAHVVLAGGLRLNLEQVG